MRWSESPKHLDNQVTKLGEPQKTFLLSMKYWLFHRGRYNGLS